MNRDKLLFGLTILISFISILVFNLLTPYMSDDFFYNPGEMRSLANIANNVWGGYLTWNGRLVPQFLMVAYLSMPKMMFNILNAICYVCLELLIYNNIDTRRYDYGTLVTICVSIWLFTVAPGQTILWLSGACNYLWATVISLGLLTCIRCMLQKGYHFYGAKNTALTVVLFLWGIMAGWCNENTSGGILLLTVFSVIQHNILGKDKESIIRQLHAIPHWCYSAVLGIILGLVGLVISPGAHQRLLENTIDENQKGIFAYVGRVLKLNEYVKNDFTIIIILLIFSALWCVYIKKGLCNMIYVYVLIVCSVITTYVLVLTPTPMDRALFGVGVFLVIALTQMYVYIREAKGAGIVIVNTLLIWGIICSIYIYMNDGVNLVRIERELSERDKLVEEQKNSGSEIVYLPMLRREWDNKYTFIYLNDITDDVDGWGNKLYRIHYDVDSIVGLPREEWEDKYGY